MTQALIPWNVTTVNSYDCSAADQNLTTDDLLVNQIIVISVGGGFGIVLPTAAALKAAALPLVNAAFRFHISNADLGAAVTLIQNTGVTIVMGNNYPLQPSVGTDFVGRFTNVGGGTEAVTIY